MSNYPAGAEYDRNAPWNKEEELQGEDVPLFDYLINTYELPYDVSKALQQLEVKMKEAKIPMPDIFLENE